MIQPNSVIKIADNSGAKIAQCLKTEKNSKKNSAKIGNFILVSIKKVQSINNIYLLNKKITKPKKKQVFKSLIITTKFPLKKKNGFYFKFSENSAILIDNNNNLISNRLNTLVSKSLKKKIVNGNKLVNFSKHLI